MENSTIGKDWRSAQWIALNQALEFHGLQVGLMQGLSIECLHDHQLTGTGAVFYQSTGLLQCVDCKGWQLIRRPIT